MSDDLLSVRSDVSGRSVIVVDEGDSVWAYLTEADGIQPERDCWLFNTPSAPKDPDQIVYRAASQPPPAPQSMTDPAGLIANPQSGRWSVRWSNDGHAAVIVVNDHDVGLVAIAERRRMSQFLLEDGPWGRPWDAELVARLGLET